MDDFVAVKPYLDVGDVCIEYCEEGIQAVGLEAVGEYIQASVIVTDRFGQGENRVAGNGE